jgi:hypothetical protein
MKMTTRSTNSVHRSPGQFALLLIPFLIGCFALSPNARAVVPAPDGGYPGGNTAEGENALLSLTTGVVNTAVGLLSLNAVTTGSFNTGLGAGTLFNTTASGDTIPLAATTRPSAVALLLATVLEAPT